MRGILASRLVWPSKWVGRAVRAKRMHKQGLDRCPKKIGIFVVGIRITQKMVCFSTRKSSKWGVCSLWGSFNLQNGSDRPWGPTWCIDKVLKDVHQKIWHFWRRNLDHPKNQTKVVEMRGMLTSGLIWPSKWVGRAMRVNWMYRQGLDGRTQKNLVFLTS